MGGGPEEAVVTHTSDLIAAAVDLLVEVSTAGVNDGTYDEDETGDECCAICQRPIFLDCNPDEACGQMRAAIRRAGGDA